MKVKGKIIETYKNSVMLGKLDSKYDCSTPINSIYTFIYEFFIVFKVAFLEIFKKYNPSPEERYLEFGFEIFLEPQHNFKVGDIVELELNVRKIE